DGTRGSVHGRGTEHERQGDAGQGEDGRPVPPQRGARVPRGVPGDPHRREQHRERAPRHDEPGGDRPAQRPRAHRPPDEGGQQQAQVQRLRPRPAHTVTSGARSAKVFSPMPLTSPSSSTELKPPCSVRQSTIRWASTGPTPGRVSRVVASALFRSIFPPAGAAPPPGTVPPPGTAAPPPASPGSGT